MEEIVLRPGLYHVGKDLLPGAYVLTLVPDSQYANVALVKPFEYSWFMRSPFTQVRLRFADGDIFRLDRPVTIRSVEPMDFGRDNAFMEE